MEKFTINAEAFGKLALLCEAMGVHPEAATDGKAADHLREVIHTGRSFERTMDSLTADADEALDALYDKDVPSGIDLLAAVVEQFGEIQNYVDALREQLESTLTALREFAAPDGWAPLRSDEEMKAEIERGFALTNAMSLGHHEGQYALLFEKGAEDDTLVTDPFVIAVGRDEDCDEIRAYVESFLDMEDGV